MKTQDALVTMTEAKSMGFVLLGAAPADSNKIVTKTEMTTYFSMSTTATPFSTYTGNRCPRYQDLLTASTSPLPNFYQYSVTRSGIPGATGAFFNYIGADGLIYQILQDTYGPVGTFCMQENSYQNNQYNIYSISQVGICFPSYTPVPATYPYPSYLQSGTLNFVYPQADYQVENILVRKGLSNEPGCPAAAVIFSAPGVYTNNSLAIPETACLINGELFYVWYTIRQISTGTVVQVVNDYTSDNVCLLGT
jgi:hypothetical protein